MNILNILNRLEYLIYTNISLDKDLLHYLSSDDYEIMADFSITDEREILNILESTDQSIFSWLNEGTINNKMRINGVISIITSFLYSKNAALLGNLIRDNIK